MSNGEIAFLCMAVGAITLFGGVLAWASWMEARDNRSSQIQRRSRAAIKQTDEERPELEMQPNRRRPF